MRIWSSSQHCWRRDSRVSCSGEERRECWRRVAVVSCSGEEGCGEGEERWES